MLLDADRSPSGTSIRRRRTCSPAASSACMASPWRNCLANRPELLAALRQRACSSNWSYTEHEPRRCTVRGIHRCASDARVTPLDTPAMRAADRNAPGRPAAAHRPRKSACSAAGGQPRTDAQPGPRNQESARRHPRRGAIAGTRTAAAACSEYTQVIIKESDRLQSLMERLLTPHRMTRRCRSISTKCWSACAA